MRQHSKWQWFGLVLALMLMTLVASCGGGSAVVNNPDPGINGNTDDPGINNPGDTDNPTDGTKTIMVDVYTPTPFGPGENPIGHASVEVNIGGGRATSATRSTSFVEQIDRDRAFPVVNGSLNVMDVRYNTAKVNGNAAGFPWSGGTYSQVTYWDAEGDNAAPKWYANTQADHDNRYAMALEIDPEDGLGDSIKMDGYNAIMTSITTGFGNDVYDYFTTNAPDGDPATKGDRPPASSCKLRNTLANQLPGNDWLQYQAEDLANVILADCGGDIDDLMDAIWNDRANSNIIGYDGAFTGEDLASANNFQEGVDVIEWLNANLSGWENTNYYGGDYRYISYAAIVRASAYVKDLVGSLWTTDAEAIYTYCFDKLMGNSFYEPRWGYYGLDPVSGLKFDDTQLTAHAAMALAAAVQYGLPDSYTDETAVRDRLDSIAEWFSERYTTADGIDFDSNGEVDTSLFLTYYRGKLKGVDRFYYPVNMEATAAMVWATRYAKAYPEVVH